MRSALLVGVVVFACSSGGTFTKERQPGPEGSAGEGGESSSDGGEGGEANGSDGGEPSSSNGGGGATPMELCELHPITARETWTATAVEADGGVAEDNVDAAFDGSLTSRWASGYQSGDEWFELDLGALAAVDRVVLRQPVVGDCSVDCQNDYPRAYELRIAQSSQDLAVPVLASGAGTPEATTIELAPTVGRYIFVRQTGVSAEDWWAINEIEVTCGP